MELKETDYKLLSYLSNHNREPITQIAKSTGLTREQVDYKISKYLEGGIIRKFFPIVNYKKLGYDNILVILIKFQRPSEIKEFSKVLKKDKNTISWGNAFGKYEVYINCIFKNEEDLSNYLSKILTKENSVSDYLLIRPFLIDLYPLKLFNNNKKYGVLSEDNSTVKMDESDKKILRLLNTDARIKLIDIATNTNSSSELVLYKIKRLQKEGILLGTRTHFSPSKLGYSFAEILLDIKSFTHENKEKIKKLARTSKHIHTLILSLSKPNCILQVLYKNESDLRDSINEIRETLKDEIIDLDLMHIDEEKEAVNSLPFLE